MAPLYVAGIFSIDFGRRVFSIAAPFIHTAATNSLLA